LSRLSVEEIRQHVISQGLVAEVSGATLWRWLSSDALRPWKHRSWIFSAIRTLPQKPDPSSIFTNVSGRVQMITSSAQTKRPVFKPAAENIPRLPLAPNRPTYVEHEYFRLGAWTYLAAWDVHRPRASAAVKSKVELLPSIGLWAKLWGKSLINLPAASFGSWTTALLIEDRGRQPLT
jgi:hypothetical protein